MKKVITYGTFDLFHQGHYNMLKRAKEYGDYLIVGVTGENYDIERGKLSVKEPLAQRIENVRKTGLADQIIVEEYLGQKIDDIIRYGVDVFVIGDDWKGKFDHLSRYCELVYLERTKGISSTQIREENYKHYSIGIATDSDDNQLISETLKVNGLKVKGLYIRNPESSRMLGDENSGYDVYGSFEDMVNDSDIIYIRTAVSARAGLIRTALEKGRHVIYDPPASLSTNEYEELYALASEKGVVLMSNIKMVHIHVFNQLLWMSQSGIIGDILSFNCSISRMDMKIGNIFYNMLSTALCPMIKIMGNNYKTDNIKTVCNERGIQFASLEFDYGDARAIINVGDEIRVSNSLEIIGTAGTIRVNGNWWRGSYFEVDRPGFDEVEIYNTNYQGNGFKYLLKTMLTMIENGRTESMGLFKDEVIAIAKVVEEVSKTSAL